MDEITSPPVAEPSPASQPVLNAEPMITFADLEKMVDENEKSVASGQGPTIQESTDQPVAPEQTAPDKPVDPLAEALSKKGFKTPEDLLKSYEEAHATITRLSQDRAKMAQDMDVLMQMQNQMVQSQQAQQPQNTGQGDFNDELYKEIAPRVQAEARAQAQAILHEERMKFKVQEKVQANPEEFQELNPIMLQLLQQYPQVGALPNGFEMVYEKAKEVRGQRVGRLLKSVFGNNVDMDKMREFFKSGGAEATPPPVSQETGLNQDVARAAYLPGSSSTSQQSQKPVDYNTQVQNLLQSPSIDRRSLVDQVTDLWWQKNSANPVAQTEAQSRNRR